MRTLIKMVLPTSAALFAVSVFAADPTIEWTGAKDLNLDNVENWNGAFPSDNTSYLSVTPTGDLTISGTTFSLYRFWMRASASIALASGQTFKMSNRMFVEGGSTVRVKSGTVGANNDLFVGDSTPNNLFVATGDETKIEVGALRVGTSANGSEIRLENGARAKTPLSVVGRKNAMGNVLTVTDAGTRLDVTQLYVGNGEDSLASSQNGLVVSNGGCVAVTTCALFGNYMAASCGNFLEVSEGGEFASSGYVYVGNNGSSNVVHIANDGVFSITNNNISIGGAASATGNLLSVGTGGKLYVRRLVSNGDIIVGVSGSRNALRVDGGEIAHGAGESMRIIVGQKPGAVGNRVEVKGGSSLSVFSLIVGDHDTANENVLTIEDGVTLAVTQPYVGKSGSSNEVCVVGATLALTNTGMSVGYSSTSVRNRMVVSDGGKLCVRQTTGANSDLYVGQSGCNNVLRFDNGVLARGGDGESVRLILGFSAGANGNRLEVLNGSSVDVSRLIVGDQGNDSKLILSNAVLRVKGDNRCQISANAGHTGNDFIISGPAARFTAGQIEIGGNSKIVFNIPKEGFNDVPVQLDNTIFRANNETPEIVVNPPEGFRKGGWHTLMRVGDAYNLVDCLNGFVVTAPEGVQVSVEKTELKVKYSSNAGLMLLVR